MDGPLLGSCTSFRIKGLGFIRCQGNRTDRSDQEGSGDAGPGLGGANCQTA